MILLNEITVPVCSLNVKMKALDEHALQSPVRYRTYTVPYRYRIITVLVQCNYRIVLPYLGFSIIFAKILVISASSKKYLHTEDNKYSTVWYGNSLYVKCSDFKNFVRKVTHQDYFHSNSNMSTRDKNCTLEIVVIDLIDNLKSTLENDATVNTHKYSICLRLEATL